MARCGSRRGPFFGAGGYDSSSIAYFSAISSVGPSASTVEKNAVDAFIRFLKTNNFYSRFERLYLRSLASQAAGLIDFITLQSSTAVNSPTWSSTYGSFTYDGATSYISSLYNPSTSAKLSASNQCYRVYARTGTLGAGKYFMGGNEASSSTKVYLRCATVGGAIAFASGNSVWQSTNQATITGLFTGIIRGSGNGNILRNKSDIISVPGASTGYLGNYNIYVGANNNNGVANGFAALEECFVSISSDFSVTENAAFYDALQTYQIAMGRQV